MKKKILLLEDNGYMFDQLKDLLEKNNFEVKDAYQVSDAKSIFKLGVDFLLVDLNVPPIGLTKKQLDQTNGGIYSGWIWLQNYVLNDFPDFKEKLIIYSAFISHLKNTYPSEVEGIVLMDKRNYLPSEVIVELNKKIDNV